MARIIGIPAASPAAPSVPVPEGNRYELNDYNKEPVPSGAFGGAIGAGISDIGQDATAAGKFFGQVAAEEQTNNLMEGMNKILYGDPDDPSSVGFYNLKGKDAQDAYPGVINQIQTLRKQARNNLYTGDSQLLFDRSTNYMYNRELATAGAHNARATQEWAKTTAAATADRAGQTIAQAVLSGDQATVDEGTHALIDARVKMAQLEQGNDLSPDVYNDIVTKGQAESAAHQIRAMAPTDPGRAATLLQQNQNILAGLPGDTYTALSNMVRARAGIASGQALLSKAEGHVAASRMPVSPQAPGVGGAVAMRVAEEARRQNIPVADALATAHIESAMGQNLGSRGNIFQLGGPEKARVGGMGGDVGSQVAGGVEFMAETRKELQTALGREPTGAEAYLAHQQGVGGALSLLNHPDTPAGLLVPAANIRANGGDPNAPASQFTSMWENRFYRTKAAYSGAADESAPTTFDAAYGDSIAALQINHGVPGKRGAPVTAADPTPPMLAGETAGVGDSPQRVLARINAAPSVPATVFLSSGASNGPQSAGYVGDQIDALKAKGATNIVVPGVGPGVPNHDAVNASLKAVVEEHGGVFFQPDVKWQPDGVHPLEVDKMRAQGLAALSHAAGPDQVAASPGQSPPSVPPAVSGPAITTPVAPPPPGMADLSAAQGELADKYARTLVHIEEMAASSEYANNPAAVAYAMNAAKAKFHAFNDAINAKKQAILDARSASATGWARKLMAPNIDPTIRDQIAADAALDAPTIENLEKFYDARTAGTLAGESAKYGAKFHDALGKIALPAGDPNRIYDPTQLLAEAAKPPNPDGTRDLSAAGLDQLLGVLAKRKAGPEGVAETDMEKKGLDYFRQQMVINYPGVAGIDKKGLLNFEGQGVPAFYKYWNDGLKAGMTPQELIDPKKMDPVIVPLMRHPVEELRTKLDLENQAASTAAAQAAAAAKAFQSSASAAQLRANPALRADFDVKYGAGASDQILGPGAPVAPAGTGAPVIGAP